MSQTLHQQLLEVRGRARAWLAEESGHGLAPSFGICNQLSLSVVDEDLLGDLCAEWPSGSGDRDYPVPHPDCDPDVGYTRARAQEMWNPEHEYARNRLTLLDWLIEQTATINN